MIMRRHASLVLIAIPLMLSACNGNGRVPTLQYVKEGESGCADIFLFKTTSDKREYLWISADKKKLQLPEKGSKTFDLADAPDGLLVKIDLWSSVPQFTPYCNCVTDGSSRETTWNAKSGKVTITLLEPLPDQKSPMKQYKASTKFENVVFEDDAGRKVTLKEETITEVLVGWYAG